MDLELGENSNGPLWAFDLGHQESGLDHCAYSKLRFDAKNGSCPFVGIQKEKN